MPTRSGRSVRAVAGSTPSLGRSGILIPVPEAEGLVGAWRARFDPGGGRGVPAHITLLFPFVDADRVTGVVVSALRSGFAAAEAFRFALARTERFMGEVLYLAPEPDEPFRHLVRGLAASWPAHPPYEGAFAVTDILPHLTVAVSGDGAELDRIEEALRGGLPIECRAHEAWLMVEDGDGWRLHTRFPFGAS